MYNCTYLRILLIHNLVALAVKFYYLPREPQALPVQWTQVGHV